MYEPCKHPSSEKRKRTLANGVVTVVLQCSVCGSAFRSLPKNGENLDLLPEYDSEFKDKKRQEWTEKWQEQTAAQSEEFWNKYNAYLCGDHWKNLRQIVLRRDPWCQVCFRKPSEQAHHLSYESFKRYGVSFSVELVGVCYDCHFGIIHPEDPNA